MNPSGVLRLQQATEMGPTGRAGVCSFFVVFILLTSTHHNLTAQTYSFSHEFSNAYKMPKSFDFQQTNNGFYILFKVGHDRKQKASNFKKVFFDYDLNPIDSAEYLIEGDCNLLTTHLNVKYDIHIFYSVGPQGNSDEKIIFNITDKQGKSISSYAKRRPDFLPYFKRKEQCKIHNMTLSFFSSNDMPDLLVFRPLARIDYNPSYPVVGGDIMAIDVQSGDVRWKCDISPIPEIASLSDNKVLTCISNINNALKPKYEMLFIDKNSGSINKTVQLNELHEYHVIGTFSSHDGQILLTGANFDSENEKNPRLFISKFNFSGDRLLQRVDSVSQFPGKHIHFVGGGSDNPNKVCLIGVEWKYDGVNVIELALAGAIQALEIGTWDPPLLSVQSDQYIVMHLSTDTGKLDDVEYIKPSHSTATKQFWSSSGKLIVYDFPTIFVYDPESPSSSPDIIERPIGYQKIIARPPGILFMQADKKNQAKASIEFRRLDN